MFDNIDLFWDVDTQVDFIEEDANLPVPGAEDIRGNLARLTTLQLSAGIPRVATRDYHTLDDEEIVEDPEEADFVETFPPHCMADTEGATFIPETTVWTTSVVVHHGDNSRPSEGTLNNQQNIVIDKLEFDVFSGNPHTEYVLDTLDPEHVLVYGVSGNVCVMHAVNGLLERGVDVTVVEDAVASLPAEGGLSSWDELRQRWSKQGVEFVSTEDVVNALS